MNPKITYLIHADLEDIAEKLCSEDFSLISVQRRRNVYRFLSLMLVNDIDGDVVELGVYTGMTGVLIQEILNESGCQKTLSLYDSFEGLPESRYQHEKDRKGVFGRHPKGDIQEIVRKNFEKRHLEVPRIFTGWFSLDALNTQLPERICFAHLDGDLYESTKISLEAVYPRLTKGGVMIVDDYNHPSWKGVRAAVEEFDRKDDLVFYDLNTTSHINDHQGIFIKCS